MKKITLIALCLLLCISLVGTVFADDAVTTVTCSADKTNVNPGEEVTVTVSLAGCPEVQAFALSVKFDQAIFEVVPGSGKQLTAGMGTYDALNNVAIIGMAPMNINGPVAQVTLRVKADAAFGDTSITAVIPEKMNINHVSVPGVVTIGTSEPECEHDWTDATCTAPKTCKLCGETEGEALGHDEVVDAAVPATCTTEGKTEGKHCARCEEVLVPQDVVPKKEHTPGAEATETTDQVCTVCGEVLVPALGHTHKLTAVEAVEPTCEKEGLKAHYVCECGDLFEDADATKEIADKATLVLPVLEHDWADATCTAPKTCKACGKTEGEALGHDEVVDAAVPATCTTDGKTEGKHCARCEEVLVAQDVIKAPGHTEAIDAAVPATCTADGKTEGKHCSVCNEVLTAQEVIKATGHVPGAEATETTDQVCTVCGEILVPALGHTHKTTVVEGVEPTCVKEGQKTHYICECGKIFEDATANAEITDKAAIVIPALGHDEVVDAAVPATCTTDGKTEGKHCARCEEVLVAQDVVKAPGHTEVVDAAVPATCTTDGKTEGKHCSVCNEVLTAQEVIEAPGHVPGAEATETTDQVCTVCGEVLVPALGHTHKTTIVEGVAATCEEAGQKTYYICECGKMFEDATANAEITDKAAIVIPALGHDWADATCTTPKTCKTCGKTEGEALGHDWTDATCTEPKTCKVCGETEGEALGHDWADATCTEPKTCKVCGKTEGKALGHVDADKDKKCDVCGVAYNPDVPQTGDESSVVLWSTMMLVSIAAAAALIVSKKNLFAR